MAGGLLLVGGERWSWATLTPGGDTEVHSHINGGMTFLTTYIATLNNHPQKPPGMSVGITFDASGNAIIRVCGTMPVAWALQNWSPQPFTSVIVTRGPGA